MVIANGSYLSNNPLHYVFVINADQKSAKRCKIELGRRNATQVEVLSGLSKGDKILISDYQNFISKKKIYWK